MANAAELRNRIVEAALRAEQDYINGHEDAWEEANDLWGATSELLELLTAIKATNWPEPNESGFFVGQEWESRAEWQGRTYRIVIERICENNPLAVMARGIGVDAARRMGMRDILRRFKPCSPPISGHLLPEPMAMQSHQKYGVDSYPCKWSDAERCIDMTGKIYGGLRQRCRYPRSGDGARCKIHAKEHASSSTERDPATRLIPVQPCLPELKSSTSAP